MAKWDISNDPPGMPPFAVNLVEYNILDEFLFMFTLSPEIIRPLISAERNPQA